MYYINTEQFENNRERTTICFYYVQTKN